MAPHLLQEFCVPVEEVQGVVLNCSRHRLDVSTCQDYTKSTDVGGPAQLRLPRSHSVEQSVITTVWQQPVNEHVSAADEDSSVWTVINVTWRPMAFLGARYKCQNLLINFLTYSRTGLSFASVEPLVADDRRYSVPHGELSAQLGHVPRSAHCNCKRDILSQNLRTGCSVHSELKTYLFSKSFPPETFSSPTRVIPRMPGH